MVPSSHRNYKRGWSCHVFERLIQLFVLSMVFTMRLVRVEVLGEMDHVF